MRVVSGPFLSGRKGCLSGSILYNTEGAVEDSEGLWKGKANDHDWVSLSSTSPSRHLELVSISVS